MSKTLPEAPPRATPGRHPVDRLATLAPSIAVAAIWIATLFFSLFAPEMVTGTDPARIPIAARVVSVAGTVATGFAALHVATRR